MSNITDIFDSSLLREFIGTEMDAGLDEESGKWEVIVKYSGEIHFIEEALGAEVEILNEGYAIITLARDQINNLYDYPEIEYIELPKRLSKNLVESLASACVPIVQSELGYGLTGRGVAVAIIDSGIDYLHPDFIGEDGKTRILCIWDQGAVGTPPAGFKSGAELDADEINRRIAFGRENGELQQGDTVGHGTAVAGVAAGNGAASGGSERGVAPGASIIAVALGRRGQRSFARTSELMRAIKYAYGKAMQAGMPLAVNLSYGTNDGSHDGLSLFETYVDDMTQKWKSVIVAASGNEGAAGHHFFAKIKPSETVEADFSVSANLQSLYLTIWKNFADVFTLELIAPSGMSSGVLPPDRESTFMHLDNTAVYVRYGQPTHYNKSQEIYIQFLADDGYIPIGVWKLVVRGDTVVDGAVDIWLPTLEEVSNGTAFLRPSTDTTLTIPSTARNVITVGGYNARINSAAAFSGRGYTRGNKYIKPDLVAPAVNVIAPRVGGGYGSFTGTSIAAPFVTGAAALMMEWGIVDGNDPFLYGQRVKAFLTKGTQRDPMTTYPNPIWGYGTLCVRASIEALKRYNPSRP